MPLKWLFGVYVCESKNLASPHGSCEQSCEIQHLNFGRGVNGLCLDSSSQHSQCNRSWLESSRPGRNCPLLDHSPAPAESSDPHLSFCHNGSRMKRRQQPSSPLGKSTLSPVLWPKTVLPDTATGASAQRALLQVSEFYALGKGLIFTKY